MITYFDLLSLSKKKKLWMISLWLLMILLVIYLVNIEYDKNTHYEQDRIYLIESMYHQITGVLLTFMITWIVLDMTHPSEMMLQSYIGLKRVWLLKHINSAIWILLLTLLRRIILGSTMLFVFDKLPDIAELKLAIHEVLDLLMIASFVHLLAPTKYPNMSFVIPFLSTMHNLLLSDHFLEISYLILPFYQKEILGYHLAIIYKLCYICLGYTLLYWIHFKKDKKCHIEVDI